MRQLSTDFGELPRMRVRIIGPATFMSTTRTAAAPDQLKPSAAGTWKSAHVGTCRWHIS